MREEYVRLTWSITWKTSTSSQIASTNTSTLSASNFNSNSGLSSAAAAGIGVGVTFLVIALVAAGAWLFWHRRKADSRTSARDRLEAADRWQHSSKPSIPPQNPEYSQGPNAQHYHHASPHELSTYEQPGELVDQRPPGELE